MNAEALPSNGRKMGAVASWKHTVVLVLILLAIAVRGAMLQASGAGTAYSVSHRLSLYASLVIAEVVLLYAVWRGIRTTGTTLGDLTRGRWTRPADIIRDIALGLALWVVMKGGITVLEKLATPAQDARSLNPLLPDGTVEASLWIVVSVVGGIVEEIVFRGYFQRQFEAATQSRVAGLAFQAILFGISHGYQGLGACIKITLVGAVFGAFAIWRQSLRPVMVAHVWTDIASGVFRL